jgi:hypothetical protein
MASCCVFACTATLPRSWPYELSVVTVTLKWHWCQLSEHLFHLTPASDAFYCLQRKYNYVMFGLIIVTYTVPLENKDHCLTSRMFVFTGLALGLSPAHRVLHWFCFSIFLASCLVSVVTIRVHPSRHVRKTPSGSCFHGHHSAVVTHSDSYCEIITDMYFLM